MNRYERYKKSGIPWLGEVPEHWEVKRLKFMLSEKLKYGANESAESDEPEQPRYIRITDIDEQGNLKDDTFKSLEFEKAKDYLLNVNDILLARSGATVGKSFLYKENLKNFACYAGYLIRARLDQKKFNANFVNYYFQSTGYWDWIKSVNIQATIQNVSAEKYNDFVLSVPTLIEQTAIAHYLDTKLGEIDALIDKQQMLLEKLAEQRTAVITHAVTKGLNPAAPMKNSSVEWLGEDVPAHWDWIKLGYTLLNLRTGLNPRSNFELNTSDAENYYVTIQELVNERIEITEKTDKINDEALKMINERSQLKVGDILLSGTGSIGKTALISKTPENWNIKEGVYALTTNLNLITSIFLLKIFQSKFILNQMDMLAMGSTVRSVKMADLRLIKIPLPPLIEQTEIADYLDQETAKIDRLCETVNQTIGRLKEYRTALITQAVTGKIKVTDE